MNFIQESINIAERLNERAGSWNHINIDDDKEANFVRTVYNYIRKTIVEKFNDVNSGIGNIIRFELLNNLLKRPNGKMLKLLVVSYNSGIQTGPVKMKVFQDEQEDVLLLSIYVDLFEPTFAKISI